MNMPPQPSNIFIGGQFGRRLIWQPGRFLTPVYPHEETERTQRYGLRSNRDRRQQRSGNSGSQSIGNLSRTSPEIQRRGTIPGRDRFWNAPTTRNFHWPRFGRRANANTETGTQPTPGQLESGTTVVA
jgi:hypothetical protein